MVEDVREIIRTVYARSAHVTANHVRELLHAAFQYGLRADNDVTRDSPARFRLEYNPVTAIPKPTKVQPGDRALVSSEVRQLWYALDDASMSHAAKCIVRLMLVTGQREQEIVGMRWDELDDGRSIWQLPVGRTKNERVHLVNRCFVRIEIDQGPSVDQCLAFSRELLISGAALVLLWWLQREVSMPLVVYPSGQVRKLMLEDLRSIFGGEHA